MLNIEETTLEINFCEYYIGQDKSQVRFSLEKFEVFEGSGEFLLSYNTEIKRVTEGEEVEFIIVNINQVATINLFYEEEIKFEKKLNIIETLRYLDTKHIVANEWVEYFVRESSEQLEFLIKVSVYLSEFNKKQLLDVKLKTTQAIQHKIEHVVIERNDNPAKKRIKRENERKKTANLVYTILVQDPNTVSPIVKPEVEVKAKEISTPKVFFKSAEDLEKATNKPPPEFEFQAKVDCLLQ